MNIELKTVVEVAPSEDITQEQAMALADYAVGKMTGRTTKKWVLNGEYTEFIRDKIEEALEELNA